MQEFNEGDLVEAVKGDTVVRGRLRVPQINNPEDGLFWVGDSGCLIGGPSTLDFTLTVVEKAAPPLPTEPGYYQASGPYASVRGTLQLDTSDQWWWVGNEYKPNPEKIPTERVSEFAPLKRLDLESVTAGRVTGAVRHAIMTDDPTYWDKLDKIAAEFGVTAQ